MKKILLLAMVLSITITTFASCNKDNSENEADEKTVISLDNLSDYDYSRLKGKDVSINVANWGEYMDLEVNKQFEELTGIEINYRTVPTNEELYSKLSSGSADYDIIIPSDYMISKMIQEKMIQKLDFNNIPNYALIDDKFKSLEFDSTNSYSVPYMWGIVAIIYNKKMIDEEITSWDALWDSKYKDEILMFNNPRDAFGIALIREGYSINTTNENELKTAADELKQQKSVVKAYVMDEIFDKMESGSAAIAPYYGGDIISMMADNPDLTYSIPTEGTNQFIDSICIPVGAKNKEAAEMYINFLCETDIAFANCDYIGYSTPHSEAYKLLDDEVKNNPLQYPDDEYLTNKTWSFINLPDETNDLTQTLWNQIKIKKTPSVYFVPLGLVIAVVATVFINVRRSRKKKKDVF